MKLKARIAILGMGMMSLILLSCLKDETMNTPPAAANGAIVSLALDYTGLYAMSVLISPLETISIPLTATRPNKDVVATFKVDYDALHAYNEDHKNDDKFVKFDSLPIGAYTIPSLTVNIPKDAASGNLDIHVKSNLLSIGGHYILPLKLESISGDENAILADNLSSALVKVLLKNAYDGVYDVSGTITRNSATGPDLALGGTYADDQQLTATTISATALKIVPVWRDGSIVGGIEEVDVTIDPTTFAATVTSTGNASLKNTPGEVNKYDPATKTLSLAFDWGSAPKTRLVKMTMKYHGPRP